MTWWNLTEVVEWQLNKQKQLKIRVSFVCNGEIQNDFKMTTETINRSFPSLTSTFYYMIQLVKCVQYAMTTFSLNSILFPKQTFVLHTNTQHTWKNGYENKLLNTYINSSSS